MNNLMANKSRDEKNVAIWRYNFAVALLSIEAKVSLSGHWWLQVHIYAVETFIRSANRAPLSAASSHPKERVRGEESSFPSSIHIVAVLSPSLWRLFFVCRAQRFPKTGRLKQRLPRRRALANANDNLARNNPSGNCSVEHLFALLHDGRHWEAERLNQKWTGQGERWDGQKTVNNRWSVCWWCGLQMSHQAHI